MVLIKLLILVAILVVSAIPLNLAVKLLGGRSSILKVIAANILAGVLGYLILVYVGEYVAILSFIAMILIYRSMFRMGWIRSMLAWLLQFVIIAIIIVVLLLFGVSLALV